MAKVDFIPQPGTGPGGGAEPELRAPSGLGISNILFNAPGVQPIHAAPAVGSVRTLSAVATSQNSQASYISDGDADVRVLLNGIVIFAGTISASPAGAVFQFAAPLLNGETFEIEVVSMLGTFFRLLYPYQDFVVPDVYRVNALVTDVFSDVIPFAPAGKANVAFNPVSLGIGYLVINPDSDPHDLTFNRNDGVDDYELPISVISLGAGSPTNPTSGFSLPFTGPGESTETIRYGAKLNTPVVANAPRVIGLYRQIDAA